MEVIDTFEEEDIRLGISPLAMLLVVLAGMLGMALFLNPSSTMFDFRIGAVIAISIVIAFAPRMGKYEGLQRYSDEGNLPRTLGLGLIGAVLLSIIITLTYAIPTQSVFTVSVILAIALPPVFEELFFRVGVFLSFQAVVGTGPAIILQAFMFSLYHFIAWDIDLSYAFVLFIGGIIFQVIFLMSKNVLSPMIAHTITNLKPYLLAMLLTPVVAIAIGGAALFILWQKYHRSR